MENRTAIPITPSGVCDPRLTSARVDARRSCRSPLFAMLLANPAAPDRLVAEEPGCRVEEPAGLAGGHVAL